MKRLFLILSALLITAAAGAQQFSIGAQAGLLATTRRAGGEEPNHYIRAYTPEYSVCFGLNASYQLSPHWQLLMQVQVANEGYKEVREWVSTIPGGGPEPPRIETRHRLPYLRIPLAVCYQILPPEAALDLGIFAGPSLGILLNQEASYTGLNQAGARIVETVDPREDLVRTMDLGAQLGLRASLDLSARFKLFLDGSVYQGFGNTLKEPFLERQLINRHASLNLGVQFHWR